MLATSEFPNDVCRITFLTACESCQRVMTTCDEVAVHICAEHAEAARLQYTNIGGGEVTLHPVSYTLLRKRYDRDVWVVMFGVPMLNC